MATLEHPFAIKLVKSPYYSITIKTNNQEAAINLINEVIATIKANAESNGAVFKVTKLPEIVLEKEFEPEESDSDSESDVED